MNKIRTVITTDMECDDMNSLIHLCLHLNDMDVAGIVYTSSQFHFNGDVVHTLGEVTPNYRCGGIRAYQEGEHEGGPDPEAAYLKEYRPFEEGWIESLFEKEYAAVWPNLIKHDPSYPSPKEMLSRIHYGNYAFEGDVRFPTEGSEFIKNLILDDDERKLYIQSWGGINTVVRALMSIEEEYRGSDEWQAIYDKVCRKTVILGVINQEGQDNSWKDHAAETWKDILLLRSEYGYGMFFAPVFTQPDSVHTYKAPWLTENIKFNHGPLMEKTILMGDGTYIKGEPDTRQFGLLTYIDFNSPYLPRVDFDRYDWLGEGDSMTWVPLLPNGLRGLEAGRFGSVCGRLFGDGELNIDIFADARVKTENDNPFLYAFQKEWAARADWCVKEYDECVHPPVISAEQTEIKAKAGDVLTLHVSVSSPDHKPVHTNWFIYQAGSAYQGTCALVPDMEDDRSVSLQVPEEAEAGDWIIVCAAGETEGFPSITRYAQFMIQII